MEVPEVGEAAEAKPKTAQVVEQQPEFADVLKGFMDRTGQTRTQAASIIGNLLDRMRIDPERRTQEAINEANRYLALLGTLPESPFKQAATEAVGMKTLRDMSAKPDPTERATKMMSELAPFMMMAPAMREMARAMSGGGSGDGGEESSLRKEFQAFKNEFVESQKDRKWEDRFAKLEQKIEGVASRPREEGESKVEKLLGELKAAYSEGKGKSEIGEKLDNLTKALTEKERASELDGIKQVVESIRSDVASKVAGLESGKGSSQDQMKQAGEMFRSIGALYEGAGTMAKSLGYEPKDEKMTGDIRKDALELAKKALGVFEKGFKQPRGEKPERQSPLPLQPVTIPVAAQPVPQEVPAEAPQAPEAAPTPTAAAEAPTAPIAAPFAKKPKPPEAAPETTPVEIKG